MDNIAGTVPFLVLGSSAADRCLTFPRASSNPCLILLEILFLYGIFVSWLHGFRLTYIFVQYLILWQSWEEEKCIRGFGGETGSNATWFKKQAYMR
jgi:hypothetical protein